MTTTAEILKGLPYFSDLPQKMLDEVCRISEQIDVAANEVIIEEGTHGEDMFVLVEGELIVTKAQHDREVELARVNPGEVVGELALLDRAPRIASVSTTMPSKLVRVPAEAFERLLDDARVLRRMFGTVITRLRSTEQVLRHEERMAALGRMAAQLMHELNNPAAAVGRSAAEISRVYGELSGELNALSPAVGGRLVTPETESKPSGLERSRLETSLMDWLQERGVADPWDLAPALIDSGWTEDLLDEAVSGVDAELAPHFLRFLGLRSMAGQLIGEIGIGAGRISELVRVVKEYSFLDQAPIQEIVITEGIDDTLILLKHKLRGIEVVKEYGDHPVKVTAPGRDLNQVWTNLIDNAADAMGGEGTLGIKVIDGGEKVTVEISDTGGGIPEEVVGRIFDPFFTTKEPGKGTGLGLHTVHAILNRSGGSIAVSTDDVGTTFTVVVLSNG